MTIRRVGDPWIIKVEQPRITSATIFSKVALIMLLLGLISLLASAIYDSYVLAFIGLGLAFWGALLLLIRPTKYVKLELMTAASASLLTNIEEMLNATGLNGKGIYLPPEPFSDDQSSLVFIPSTAKQSPPKREETTKTKASQTSKLFQMDQAEGLYLTPPGYALSKMLEKQLGKPFTEIDLQEFQRSLPTLLEELDITKHSHVNVEGEIINIKAKNHIFKNLCEETRKLERTREAVGSPLSSALACALARATRKPVTIESEEQSQDGDTTTIRYRILEE